MEELTELYQSLVSGKLWAATLTVGDLFIGCRPVAELHYPNSAAKVRLFITGAMDVLDRTKLYVDDNGVITRLERMN